MKRLFLMCQLLCIAVLSGYGLEIPVHVDTGKITVPDAWSVSGGIPLPQDALRAEELPRLALLDENGKDVCFQTRPLAWWEAKNSIKWLELAFNIPAGKRSPAYKLILRDKPVPVMPPMKIHDDGRILTLENEFLRLHFDRTTGLLADRIEQRAGNGWSPALTGGLDSYLQVRDIEGGRSGFYSTSRTPRKELKIERSGPAAITLLIRTTHTAADGRHTFPVDLRLTLFCNQNRIRLFHTAYFTENPAVAVFPQFGIRFRSADVSNIRYGLDGKEECGTAPFSLRQDNSATPVYPKMNGFRPFCSVENGKSGIRCANYLRTGGTTVILRRMFEEFPKGFRVSPDGEVRVEFWPSTKPEPMDFRRIDQRFPEDYQAFKAGESKRVRGYDYNMDIYHRTMTKERELLLSAFGKSKSHEVWLDFSRIPPAGMAEIADHPLLPFVSGKWNCDTMALGLVSPENAVRYPGIEHMWELQWDTMRKHQTEWFHWYGMFSWGDWQTNYFPKEDRWGNYDTKYGWRNGGMDIPYSIMLWYFRSGKRKYFETGEPAVLNLADISSSHSRAYADEQFMPRWWNAAGTCRYNMDHFGSGAGLDPQHLFCHSIQLGWLLTGNDYFRELIADFADSYYHLDKPFNYKKYHGTDLHYHGREVDMPMRLAGNAYENDPGNPRNVELLDFFTEVQICSLKNAVCRAGGKAFRSCSNQEIREFFYTLYHLPALNYLMTLRKNKPLEDAMKHGIPQYRTELSNAIGYIWLWKLTGNLNYAKYAMRQTCSRPAYRNRTLRPSKNIAVIPEIMGGTFSCYPALLIAADAAGGLSPENFSDAENNYYPVSLAPFNRKLPENPERCLPFRLPADPKQDSMRTIENPADGPVVFDFGERARLAPGCLPVTPAHSYPSDSDTGGEFSGLPLGRCAGFNGILFDIGKDCTVLKNGRKIRIPVNENLNSLSLLTGVSFAADPFHNRPGAEIVIRYENGTEKRIFLENMKHYQHRSLIRLYCDRDYYAGRINGINFTVVTIPLSGRVRDVLLRDTGIGADVAIFGLTGERRNLPQKGKTPSNGKCWMKVEIAMTSQPGAPLDLFADGRKLLAGVVPLTPVSVYYFPVEIRNGKLPELKLIPGFFSHKTGSFKGKFLIRGVSAHPAALLPERKEGTGREKRIYGWNMPENSGNALANRNATELARTGGYSEKEILLNWDGIYLNDADRMEFIADLPSGAYDAEIRLMSTAYSGFRQNSATFSLQGDRRQAQLPSFVPPPRGGGSTNSAVPRHLIVKGHVRDRLVFRLQGLPRKKRSICDIYGIASVKITRSGKSGQKEGIVSVETETMPWKIGSPQKK